MSISEFEIQVSAVESWCVKVEHVYHTNQYVAWNPEFPWMGYGSTEAEACEDFVGRHAAQEVLKFATDNSIELSGQARPTAKIYQFPKRGRFA